MSKKSLIIITGCSSGIGLALSQKLIEKESNCVLGIARNCPLEAENFIFQSLDLSKIDRVKEIQFPDLDKEYGDIHLINNAGMLGEINTLDKIDLESIEDVITVNYTAAMLLSTKFIQKYQNSPLVKSIINISSGAATGAYASWSNYCASKAALEMLSKCIEVEQKDKVYPVKCFSIAPGVVNTKMQAQIRSTDIENFAMLPKFEELYTENMLYSPISVAEKLIEVIEHPEGFQEKVFRIQV
jgi:benzil reductase ((S)-benzoin forming)